MRIQVISLIFATLITCQSALANICNLNIRGHEICVGKAALQESQLDNGETKLELVFVKEFKYPKVWVEKEGEKLLLSVDELIGHKDCAIGDQVCDKDQIRVAQECKESGLRTVQVVSVFQNDTFAFIQNGLPLLGRRHSFILPIECVDQVFDKSKSL